MVLLLAHVVVISFCCGVREQPLPPDKGPWGTLDINKLGCEVEEPILSLGLVLGELKQRVVNSQFNVHCSVSTIFFLALLTSLADLYLTACAEVLLSLRPVSRHLPCPLEKTLWTSQISFSL